jgi:ATP-dependent DNA helicase RecG
MFGNVRYNVQRQEKENALMKITELFPDILAEDREYEFKAVLNPENPVKWAKTIVGFANSNGGILFVGVANNREAFGIGLDEIDETKNLVTRINDRNIFPHVKIRYMIRSVDDDAERFVLAINISPSDSIIRYREGDFNEPEDIISLSKRKFGVDNETSEIYYNEAEWTSYLTLCGEFRKDSSTPTVKELQNEEIVSRDGYAKTGFLMFKDGYDGDDSLICCRLWRGKTKTGDVLDSRRFKGSLSDVFKETIGFIERNTKTGWKKMQNGGREEIRSYPKIAIREALINAIAHRNYSIAGTQIDVDIFIDRIDIVSPCSWLLPKNYEEYPLGSIPSVRRNTIIAACLDVANLMERGGTGFQAMADSYKDYEEEKQPGVLMYPGFLNLRLFDLLFQEDLASEELTDTEKVIELLKESPRPVKELQAVTRFKSRSRFLEQVLNPLLETEVIVREGSIKSPTALIKLNKRGSFY